MERLPRAEVPTDQNTRNMGLPPTRTMLSAYRPADGELLWQSEKYNSLYPITLPVQLDTEHLFLTSGYQSGSSLLRIVKEGDEYQVSEIFHHEKGSQIHVPILVNEYLYVLANENDNHPRPRRNEGGLMCLNLKGEVQWRTGEDPFFGRGAMIYADGMLIIQDGFDGTLRLVQPSPDSYQPLAEANVFGIEDRRDHEMWAPLALANGRLLMRSQDTLLCLDLRAESY